MPDKVRPTPEMPPLRELNDAKTLRALAHPVRLALLEALLLEGELTATDAAELVGESPANCSFHLRQLAKYGFVEESGTGKGRQRPWRLKSLGNTISADTLDAPETSLAARGLTRLFTERALGRWRAWWDTQHAYPAEWRAAADASEAVAWLTVDELRSLNERLLELLLSHRELLTDPSMRPPGAVPVEILAFTFPLRQPEPDPGG